MALAHGRSSRVHFGGLDLTGHLHTAELSIEVDNADVTTFDNSGWRSNVAGLAGVTASFEGYQDVALQATVHAALGVDSGVLSWCPSGGGTVGDLVRMLPVSATSLGESAGMDGAAALSWAVAAQGCPALGYVLRPKGEDTNTTTGATRDDSAATSTGWVAHLHVFAVDGGSWVVKLQDSADSSSWSDVSGGAFAAATGATAERLVSAATTTTLRRYVRYVATRTGGSAGDGITFALGLSRVRYQ